MKKIGFLLAAVALLAGGAGIKAQDVSPRHVYFSEGFSGEGTRYDTAVWNMAADTALRLFYSMGTETGCPAPEAVLGYWPDAGLKDILRDTVRLVSNPFDLQKASCAYVSMKYTYKAYLKGSDDGMRSFGLAARRPGGDWMPCGIVGNGGLEKTMGPARLLGELPAALKDAPAVEVCVYLQNRLDVGEMKNYFLLYFDDIEFFAYPEAYYNMDFSWKGQPYVFIGDEADGLSVSLQMENAGNTLTSGKIAYTFDGGEPQYIDLTPEAPLLPGQTYTVPSFEPAGWTEAAEGHHTLVFWLAEANGTALAETAIVKHRKILSKLAPATVTTYPYRPLVEEFSSSTCPTCASRNRTLQPIFDALADSISVLKYQMNFPGSGDPYYTGDGGLRRLFYNVLDIPAICLDGKKESGSGTNKLLAALREKIQSPAYLDLAFDTLALDADTNVYVVLNIRSSVPVDGVLQTVVLEGQTENNAATNGETSFHHVMLKMLPGADGLPVSLAPDAVYTFRFAYDMKKTFMEEADDLKVVCFLQTYGDTVLQSVLGDVTMRIQAIPDLANERTEGYTRLAVYPNPASEAVVLPALDRATVEVFNMAGRRVFHQYGVQGDYRLDVRDFRPGIYVIRVVEAGRTAWAKISVVR